MTIYHLEQLFSVRATSSNFILFEQLFTRVQTLQYEMLRFDKQLHFLASHEQRPWV